MNKIYKKIISMITFILLISLLVGCKNDAVSGGRLSIVVAGNLNQVWEQQFVKEHIIPGFEKEFNAVVDFQILSAANAKTKIETEQRSGVHSSDMVMLHTGEMSEFINLGWVKDITEDVEFPNRTMTTLFESNTHSSSGDQYFHMVSYDVYLTIANIQAKPYLPKNANFDQLTWEQFVQWSINIKNGISASDSNDGQSYVGRGPKTMFASLAGANLIYQIAGIGLSYGADFVDIDSPGMIQAWNVINNLSRNQVFIPEQNNFASPVDKLKDGSAWLAFAHMGPIGEVYSYAPNNFEVAPAPIGSNNARGTIAGGWGLGLLNGSKNHDLAVKFAEYLTRVDVSYDYCSGLGGLISPVEEVKGQLALENTDVIMSKGILMMENPSTVVRGVPSANYTNWNSVKTVYESLFNKVASGYNSTSYQTQFISYELPIAKQQINGLVKTTP